MFIHLRLYFYVINKVVCFKKQKRDIVFILGFMICLEIKSGVFRSQTAASCQCLEEAENAARFISAQGMLHGKGSLFKRAVLE